MPLESMKSLIITIITFNFITTNKKGSLRAIEHNGVVKKRICKRVLFILSFARTKRNI